MSAAPRSPGRRSRRPTLDPAEKEEDGPPRGRCRDGREQEAQDSAERRTETERTDLPPQEGDRECELQDVRHGLSEGDREGEPGQGQDAGVDERRRGQSRRDDERRLHERVHEGSAGVLEGVEGALDAELERQRQEREQVRA